MFIVLDNGRNQCYVYYINRRTNMINSRQIVDLIKKECTKEKDTTVISAYRKLIDRIEVLEDLDMSRDRRERFVPPVLGSELTREQAVEELNKLFKV